MTFTKRQITANRKAWIKALRSGKYKQTTGQLCRAEPYAYTYGPTVPAGHCCLGVACEVLAKRGVIKSFDRHALTLPEDAQEALGLSSCTGTYGRNDNLSLTERNDDCGWSFKKIAALIERKPKGLFVEDEG